MFKLYGLQGRTVSAIAGLAGVLSAFVAASQAAGLFSLVPPKYLWVTTSLPIVALFLTGFSERIQGGASSPQVRQDAQDSDERNAAIDPPDQQGGGG